LVIAVDSSALVAIVLEEPGCDRLERALLEGPVISAATLLETHVVIRRRRPDRLPVIDLTLTSFRAAVAPVTAAQIALARAAYDRYGKGRGHPAQLNFGDCFAYALATSLDAPLLYKGGDFARTDVRTAAA
jgi:ribonuclease VapC